MRPRGARHTTRNVWVSLISSFIFSSLLRADNVDSYSEGIRRVQEGEFVFIYGIGPLQYASGQEPCNMEVLDIPLVTFG